MGSAAAQVSAGGAPRLSSRASQERSTGVLLEQVNTPHIAAQLVERLVPGDQIEAPLSAADVRKPLRRLWPT
jgi:hypothetical protein